MSDSISKIMEGRRGIYALLGTLFLEPPPRALIEDLMKGEIPLLERLNKVAEEFKDADEFEEAVKEEFSSLFIDPFQKTISPYQSTYEGDNPYGKVTQRIAEKYKQMGYNFAYTEPADHIGVELFFLAESCKNAISDQSEPVTELQYQKEFLENELGWVRSFCNAINQSQESHFYKEVSNVLLEFLEKDSSLIDDLIVQAMRS
ncbi:MAG: molecular chaperone TorD family protein [Archaeoglobaceae archaeon]